MNRFLRNFFIAHREAAICFLGGAVIVSLAIYLTPLKHLNLIGPKIKDIPSAEFHRNFKAHPEKYDFIDVRPQAVYAEGHAEGSRNIPLHQMYFQHSFLPKHGKTIVLICSGGIASGVAYGYLEHYGFLNLRRIEDGIEAWRAAGLPVVASPPSPE